jgi:hypothetical protein
MKTFITMAALLCCLLTSCTDYTRNQPEPSGCYVQSQQQPQPVIPVVTTKSGKKLVTVYRQPLPKKVKGSTVYLYWVYDSWGRWNSVTDAHVRWWQGQGYLVRFLAN